MLLEEKKDEEILAIVANLRCIMAEKNLPRLQFAGIETRLWVIPFSLKGLTASVRTDYRRLSPLSMWRTAQQMPSSASA